MKKSKVFQTLLVCLIVGSAMGLLYAQENQVQNQDVDSILGSN